MPNDIKLPPPSGDPQRAEGYVNQLVPLISQSKLKVSHTDLSKYDPSSLHDHYSLNLQEYQVEVSHSKQPTTGRDSYVILFNNLKNLSEGQTQKEILAYLVISEEQFKKIKDVADEQIETLKKIEEEKRFQEAMTPVDALLDKIAKGEVDVSKPPQPVPELPEEEEKKSQETLPGKGKEVAEPTLPEEVAEPVAVEERNNPQAAPTQAETSSPTQSVATPGEPVSALAAAAAIPVAVEETPEPGTLPSPTPAQPEEAPVVTAPAPQGAAIEPIWPPPAEQGEPETPTQKSDTPPESSSPAFSSAAPLSAPVASIEEVQEALKKAYEQTPSAAVPEEYRPETVNTPQATNLTSSPLDATINTIPAPTQPTPHIDQAIDQAFKPANNTLLTHQSNTPDV